MEQNNSKKCIKCGHYKLKSEFNRDLSKKDGLFRYCRVCSKRYDQEFYIKNKERIKKKSALSYSIYSNNPNLYFNYLNKKPKGIGFIAKVSSLNRQTS